MKFVPYVFSYAPITYLLPGKRESSLAVIAQQINDKMAIAGMANHTGRVGCATSPPITHVAMGARKNMCIRSSPKDKPDKEDMIAGAFCCLMQVKSMNNPKVANKTFGVQNSQAHSNVGVSIIVQGMPFHQQPHAVKTAPARKQIEPMASRFPCVHLICTRI